MFEFFKKKQPPERPNRFPPIPEWQPAIASNLQCLIERAEYYTNAKRDFAVFTHGTIAILPLCLSDVRYWHNCNMGVFKDRTRAELELASHVSRRAVLTDDNEIVGWIGEPGFDWMAEESEMVTIRTHHPLDASTESRLRMAFPKVTDIAERLPQSKWIMIGTFSLQAAANLDTDIRTQCPSLKSRNASLTLATYTIDKF